MFFLKLFQGSNGHLVCMLVLRLHKAYGWYMVRGGSGLRVSLSGIVSVRKRRGLVRVSDEAS